VELRLVVQALQRKVAARRPEGRLTTHGERYTIAALLSPLRLPLPKLFGLFGTDKQKEGGHSYAHTYADVLGPFRSKRIKLLEIGVLMGASLLGWRAYFPRASIAGFDIEPKPEMARGRVRVYQGDQGSAADLDRVCANEGPFDVIIDDGSHLNRHQVFTFHHLFPHLKDGGIYVIEDTQTSFWRGSLVGFHWDGCDPFTPEFKGTCVGEFLELAKYLNHAEFLSTRQMEPQRVAVAKQIRRIAFEHNLIVVWKGPNVEPSNIVTQR
jgi:Methyltransferase domain